MTLKRSRIDGDQKSEKAENVEQKTNSGDEEITLKKKDLEALIDSRIAESGGGTAAGGKSTEEMVKMLADAINKKDYELPDDFGYTAPADLDPEDMLEEPLVFWAPGFNVVIGDDTKNGRKIPPPVNRVIWFKPDGSRKVQNGREIDIQIWSKYACYSKKEAEWLQNHSLYSIVFFLHGSTKMDVDMRFTQKLLEYSNGLRNMESHRVVKEARDLGLAFTSDVNELRLALAHQKTKEYMKQFQSAEHDRLLDNAKQEKLLKS